MKSRIKSNIEADGRRVSLPDLIGGGYGEFWRSRHRYRVVKGSRSSKKSTTMALWIITHMMMFPEANTLVVRKVQNTLRDSCFAQLRWAVHQLRVRHLWHFSVSPLEATYVPTGQRIFFRGLDDPLKIASITVDVGVLCWLWLEEAYEVMDETDFDILDESIRGEVPDGLWKQLTLTLNPWNERHWIKKRFFDTKGEEILALSVDYRANEFLDEADIRFFEDMKERNPRRYNVAGLGNWGLTEGLIYDRWREERFDPNGLPPDTITTCGLDYGYTNDPSAFIVVLYSKVHRTLWIWDEIYEKRLSNAQIFDRIQKSGYTKEQIIGDSAEPKSNFELRRMGLRIQGARKGRDSVKHGIQWIQDMDIIVHPRCINFMMEISNYGYALDRYGKSTNVPIDEYNHLMDAMRYALEPYMTPSNRSLHDIDATLKTLRALGV